VLADLARSPVKQVEKLSRVRGLPRPVEAEHGVEIVNATNRALSLPAAAMPHVAAAELSPSERFNADALWSAAQTIGAGRAIDPALVSNRNEISELARHLAQDRPLDELPIMTGWRRDAVGEALLDLVRGQRRITLSWADGSLRTEI
jgi:ribonuclease D